ncbi:UPF0057-domain-containing protein [Ophiobolus disseminans]|uniref:UPF0057-domain-containing protein n=1 Tax=Ophiobolus disseminans TaxID=1469910 RepID=A0A6A7A3D0_9PLEO|nr:UPF0057-domain-containing protein [Ophiobolus disseminans]
MILLIILTLIFPPIGVFLTAGIGPDLLINLLLTILGFFPGHIHAFYIEYVFYKRRDEVRRGIISVGRAPGVFSERVQSGGTGRGVVVEEPVQEEYGPAQQGYAVGGQQGYGTVQ